MNGLAHHAWRCPISGGFCLCLLPRRRARQTAHGGLKTVIFGLVQEKLRRGLRIPQEKYILRTKFRRAPMDGFAIPGAMPPRWAAYPVSNFQCL